MTDEYTPEDANVITLTDEEGKECSFEIIAEKEIEGITYYALFPLEDNEDGEYVLLKLEKDEDPLDAAMRELREECGAVCDELKPLGEIYPSPGYTNEIIRLYACVNPTFVEQELDEDEFLQVCKMKLSTLLAKIMSGEIKDAKTIVAAMKLKELRNK